MIIIGAIAVFYVLVVYPIVKILQGVREDVRKGETTHPTQGWTVLD